MTQPYLALITPLSGHPDQGLPPVSPGVPTHPIAPGSPGSPSQPIYHPGHPDHGLPAYPDQGLPGAPPGFWGGSNPHPDQGLPPGGETVPPDEMPPPPIPPAEYADDIIVQLYVPGKGWTTKAYPIGPNQGLPGAPSSPAPTPHARGKK